MKENHGETNGQYKRERRKRKKKEKKEKKRKKNLCGVKVRKENHSETNGQYKRERYDETLRGELLKCMEREKKNMQGKRITVERIGSIRGKDTVKH